jgi:hypothetical protein
MNAAFPDSILLVGSGAMGSLENAYYRSLQRVCRAKVELIDVAVGRLERPGSRLLTRGLNRALLSPASSLLAGRRLSRHLCERVGGYDAVIVFKGSDFSRALLARCRALVPHAVWVNINPDDPLNIASRGSTNANIVDSLGFYDLYCTWSRTLLGRLSREGCRRTALLPFGYDSDHHVAPPDFVVGQSATVSFVGAWDPQREALLTGLADYPLRIYGNGWDRAPRRSPLWPRITPKNIYREELVAVIAGSAVSLNILRSQNMGSHNMRTFEIPAMGGLMLTTRTEEQQRYFPEDEACLMYAGLDELRAKLDCVLRDAELAQRIRHKGAELVRGNSYDERAKLLLEQLALIGRKA